MGNNGGPKTEKRKKKCPFLNGWCIGNECEMMSQLSKNEGGLLKTFSLCSVKALVVMISELNAKTQPPQQKIQLPPNLFRG